MSEQQKPRRKIITPDPRHVGEEPDYRFTLANERTFLAWIRTALAISAGGLAAMSLLPDLRGKEILGLTLLALSVITSGSAFRHWAANEEAMRKRVPLPRSRLPRFMALCTALVTLLAAVLVLLD